MFRPINYELVRSIALSVLLLSISAMGQFEVAPDHFDSTSKKETVCQTGMKNRVKPKVSARSQANSHRSAGRLQAARELCRLPMEQSIHLRLRVPLIQ